MKQRKRPVRRVGIIGAGRVGSALAWHCRRLGYRIVGITDKKPKQAWVVYGLLKEPYRRWRPSVLAMASDILFITVPDRAIEPVFSAIRRYLRRGTIVVHCSGVLGIDAFRDASEQGVEVLALHPVQSFPSHAEAIRTLTGCFFALEGSRKGLALGRNLVRRLKGSWVEVTGPDRPLYHTMCVFASNFESVLMDAAEAIAARLGISPHRAGRMLAPLMRSVLENAVEYGTLASLTGPVQRGDTRTVARHLEALSTRVPELVPLYRACSLRLVDMAKRQGLDAAAVAELRSLLRD
ncbi:MAG: DUF2520 domain-containing protein [candidate division WOR-3 bacterium]